MRVPPASVLQQLKMRITQIEEGPPQARSVLSPAFTMLAILAIIFPARIMKDGEEPHHLNNRSITGRDIQCVRFNPPPVIWSMNRIKVALKFFGDVSPHGLKIDGDDLTHKSYSGLRSVMLAVRATSSACVKNLTEASQGHEKVESKKRFPLSHTPDYGDGRYLFLPSRYINKSTGTRYRAVHRHTASIV
jgi:hypothetical protein